MMFIFGNTQAMELNTTVDAEDELRVPAVCVRCKERGHEVHFRLFGPCAITTFTDRRS